MPYLDNASPSGADWTLILARIDVYLLQIKVLKITTSVSPSKSGIFSWKEAKMAEKAVEYHILAMSHRQKLIHISF